MAKLKQFLVQLRHAETFTEKEFVLFLQRVGFELYTRIVRRTPVDTGLARANWNISIGQPDRTLHGVSRDTLGRANAALRGLRLGQHIWISNGLPYIVPLEEGHSRQSPPGVMVALSVQEIEQLARTL